VNFFYKNETGAGHQKSWGEVARPEGPRSEVEFLRTGNMPLPNQLGGLASAMCSPRNGCPYILGPTIGIS